jgi:hypothetical protein
MEEVEIIHCSITKEIDIWTKVRFAIRAGTARRACGDAEL